MNAAANPTRRGALLSLADEGTLARLIERGDLQARDTMIESNLRLVHAVAATFRGSGVPFVDLVQEGTIGLVRAVELFDRRRDVRFSTYAVWWIRRSMRDAIAGANAIRIPAKAHQQLAAVRRAEAKLQRRSPRRASDVQIADLTGLSVKTVRALRTAAQVTASLDEPVGEGTTTLRDLIADTRAVDPSESAVAQELRDDVLAMLRFLPRRHREVLVRRYGLHGGRVQTHNEIARWLGVGEERSRQIERESLQRLRSISATACDGRTVGCGRRSAEGVVRTLRARRAGKAPARVASERPDGAERVADRRAQQPVSEAG
jgi:RNA polymerase primary sigma factor